MHTLSKVLISIIISTLSSISFAASGPLILGGDDADDHGSRTGGVNTSTWAYAEAATASIIAQSTNPGTTIDIVAIGPIDPGANNYPGSNSGGMVNSVAANLGLNVLFLDGQAAIAQFFTDLSNATVVPKMIWIVSDGAVNDLDPVDEAELALHGTELNTFQQSGGGILSHTHGYAWLTSLIPGISIDNACGTLTTLTPAGNTAFPTITNAQINSQCHSSFSGNLGGLSVLATNNANPALSVIIGGAAGVTIAPTTDVPTLSFWGLLLMTLLLGFMGKSIRRHN